MRDRPDDPAALAEVVRRLMTIRNRLGVAAFRDACSKALVAIGRSALTEAEKKSRAKRRHRSNVIPFRRRTIKSDVSGSSETT